MDKDTHAQALEQFKESDEATSLVREEAYRDVRFARLSDQWPKDVRKSRKEEGRPCLTINKLPAFIRQVVNDARQSKPAIRISPVDNGADVNTAKVIAGLIRAIERKSDADVAYDTAIDHAATGGFGFFRLGIDYAAPDSFELEARIERIPNPLMVHWDVNSTRHDAEDWEYAFVSDWLTREQFEATYPDAEMASFDADSRDAISYWIDDDNVRVAEYWAREEAKKTVILLSNGAVVREEKLGDHARSILREGAVDVELFRDDEEAIRAAASMAGLAEQRRREATFHEVTRRILSGSEVLEEEPWPGTMIPICPVWGEEIYSDGIRHFRSMIRDAKDPQAMFNFWRSASTELVALAPRAPWVVQNGSIPPEEMHKWETANTRSHAYLAYEKGYNQPRREPFAGVPAGAIQEALNASDDIKAITGIYDSSLGARSNETSGRAILARENQANVSNYHFIDNMARAIRYAGRCLVEIIPAVYSARETVRILGEDMAEEVVQLTTGAPGKVDPETGERQLYNLTVGRYDVSVSTGPSYATQREETREALIEIMRAVPGSAPLIGDVLMEHLDFAGAEKVAERLKLLLPPQIQQKERIPVRPPMQAAPQGAQPAGPAPQDGQGQAITPAERRAFS